MGMADYAGPFDPTFELRALSRDALARLGREYMMVGHLVDRGLMPHVAERFGAEGIEGVAIDEWMGASPVYTARMRRALGIEGDDVPAIMKALQLDVGAPHQYMDFRFEVSAPDRGSFWLQSCGALLDVEPFGEQAVFSMCHAIEDPTFDATAIATNPRARVRPIHRPPRQPAGRVPHCHWQITIDPATEPLVERELTRRVAASRLAQTPFARPADAEDGGLTDYAGAFDPTFQLEDLAHGTLVATLGEFLLQCHLLLRAADFAIRERADADVARDMLLKQWVGVAWVATERLCHAMRIDGTDVASLLKVVQLHPSFPPGYAPVRCKLVDAGRGHVWLDDCDALAESEPAGWLALLGRGEERALAAIVQAQNPQARCRAIAPTGTARFAWEITIDEQAEPATAPPEVALVRLSGSSRFRFASGTEFRTRMQKERND
jgi:hypothetical protein